jgi:hypothetical protein
MNVDRVDWLAKNLMIIDRVRCRVTVAPNKIRSLEVSHRLGIRSHARGTRLRPVSGAPNGILGRWVTAQYRLRAARQYALGYKFLRNPINGDFARLAFWRNLW